MTVKMTGAALASLTILTGCMATSEGSSADADRGLNAKMERFFDSVNCKGIGGTYEDNTCKNADHSIIIVDEN